MLVVLFPFVSFLFRVSFRCEQHRQHGRVPCWLRRGGRGLRDYRSTDAWRYAFPTLPHSPPFRACVYHTAPRCTALHRTALHCATPRHTTSHHTAPHRVCHHTTVNNTVSQLSHYISSPLPHSHVAAVAYRCCIRAQALCGSIRCPPGSQGMSWVWAHPSDLRCGKTAFLAAPHGYISKRDHFTKTGSGPASRES